MNFWWNYVVRLLLFFASMEFLFRSLFKEERKKKSELISQRFRLLIPLKFNTSLIASMRSQLDSITSHVRLSTSFCYDGRPTEMKERRTKKNKTHTKWFSLARVSNSFLHHFTSSSSSSSSSTSSCSFRSSFRFASFRAKILFTMLLLLSSRFDLSGVWYHIVFVTHSNMRIHVRVRVSLLFTNLAKWNTQRNKKKTDDEFNNFKLDLFLNCLWFFPFSHIRINSIRSIFCYRLSCVLSSFHVVYVFFVYLQWSLAINRVACHFSLTNIFIVMN